MAKSASLQVLLDQIRQALQHTDAYNAMVEAERQADITRMGHQDGRKTYPRIGSVRLYLTLEDARNLLSDLEDKL